MAERVFVSAEDLEGAQFFALNHPRTNTRVQFARTASKILEIQRFSEATEPRSWLIIGGQDRVLQDGSLFLATPVDPLFILLPQVAATNASPQISFLVSSMLDLISCCHVQLLRARGATDGERRGYFQPLSDVISGDDSTTIQVRSVLHDPRRSAPDL